MEYTYRTDEDGEPVECDCCGYPAPLSEFSGHAEHMTTATHLLCEVCSSTHLSSSVWYPSQCPDERLWRSIGWIANLLREEIKSLKA